MVISVPPLAEQRRIVAKVDELMALCGRLEAARGSREAVRDGLAAVSLARLNVPDPETFQADARFALDALPALIARPDQIKALRQTIFNLARESWPFSANRGCSPTACRLSLAPRTRTVELGVKSRGRDAVAAETWIANDPNGNCRRSSRRHALAREWLRVPSGGNKYPLGPRVSSVCLPKSARPEIVIPGGLAGGPALLSETKSSEDQYGRLVYGRSERIRTSDPIVPNDVRYQAALHSDTAAY
jgi:hypothetical protein